MSKKKKRRSAEWPPSGLLMAGANNAWTNAKDWLCDAERLAQADGTPAHIVTLALYAEEEAAKAFTWTLAYFAQIFLHLSVPLLEREMGPNLDDHAFRLYMAHFLEGIEVTTNGVEVFGISSTQLDDIVIEGSLETEEDLMNTLMYNPQMLSVIQQFIRQLSPDLDAEQARVAIKRMRTERNHSIYMVGIKD